MKYYLFLLIASIYCFTVLCVSGATVVSVQGGPTVADADPFNGNMETFLQAFSQIETSSNPFITFFRDMTKKGIASFETDKKFVQDAVNEGTEMEKKIQSISVSLKNSTVRLPAELQSELEEIEKNAAAELKKLKGVEDVKDIEEMHKRYKEKYAEIKGKIEEVTKFALEQITKDKAEELKAQQAKATTVKTQAVSAHTALVAQESSKEDSNAFVEKAKKLLIELIKTWVPVLFTMNKDTDAISKKKDVASSALSNIRNDLIKVEQIQYHFLRASKDLFKTDVAFLTRSSMVPFAFAIMFGMLF